MLDSQKLVVSGPCGGYAYERLHFEISVYIYVPGMHIHCLRLKLVQGEQGVKFPQFENCVSHAVK